MKKNVKLLTELRKMKDLISYMSDEKLIKEGDDNLRSQLHRLVGTEMKLDKRVNMSGGAGNHVQAHLKAEKELEDFLRENPSMMDFVEEVEEHFLNQLYR
jgi:hypothetical protein